MYLFVVIFALFYLFLSLKVISLRKKVKTAIKVERELYYIDDKKRLDNTLTDENGCFTLPAVNIRSKAPGWLFVDQRTQQYISANFSGKNYVLWSTSLKLIEPITAYDKKLSQLNADLLNNEIAFTFIDENNPNIPHCARSICRWVSDFEILHIIED